MFMFKLFVNYTSGLFKYPKPFSLTMWSKLAQRSNAFRQDK